MARKISIGLGLMRFPFSGPAAFWSWVDLCEKAGIDSIWQSDRIAGAEPILECLTAMAALAGRTRRLKFGMNVLSLGYRDPVLVAKQCATIDVLSEGRLLPAFGVGSDHMPDWAMLNVDRRGRGARTDEALEIIRRLWSEATVDFEGEFYRLSAAAIAPRPVQAELPMWIGGSSEAAIRRTARFGTGWQAGAETPVQAAQAVERIRAALAQSGRKIDEDHYGAGFPYRIGSLDGPPALRDQVEIYRQFRAGADPFDYVAVGTSATIIDRIARYVDAGISKFILRPIADGDADIMAQTTRLAEDVLPAVKARYL